LTKELPKILVITREAWQDTNNTGNTLSNLLSEFPVENIANIYCRQDIPDNSHCSKYYRITEKSLLRSIFSNRLAGEILTSDRINSKSGSVDKEVYKERKLYDFFREHRYVIFLALRELLWKMGKWDNKRFENFIRDFSPDVIFMNNYDSFYMHDILEFCKRNTRAKVVLFFADDNCSLKQYNISPLYWINRLLFRSKVRKSIRLSEKRYGITEELCEEYKRVFNTEFTLLYKGGQFAECEVRKDIGSPVRLVYAGTLQYERWKTLSKVARALSEINRGERRAEMNIYSQDRIPDRIRKKITLEGISSFFGAIAASEVKRKLQESDIVLHVESFSLKRKLLTRLSFSTKIVDLFNSARCIFAVGWKEAASIRYLVNNDAAIVATSEKVIKTKLHELLDNPSTILEYGRKAWDCGQRNHKDSEIKAQFYEDLISLKSKF